METNEIINADKPVLIDFYANCATVKTMAPIVTEQIGKSGADKSVLKIDVDKNPGSRWYQIQAVPTLMILKNGLLFGNNPVVSTNKTWRAHYSLTPWKTNPIFSRFLTKIDLC